MLQHTTSTTANLIGSSISALDTKTFPIASLSIRSAVALVAEFERVTNRTFWGLTEFVCAAQLQPYAGADRRRGGERSC